mmetsp:Transcript_7876/g.16102  ORF Transcript_7876/g.16102 Transcript_7876/m.16102 type:complete len:86 (+) Transcript_7876:104-361(+)
MKRASRRSKCKESFSVNRPVDGVGRKGVSGFAEKVSTYGTLAKELGSSARAVGQALRRNPFAPGVPCHRVVAATLDGRLPRLPRS